MSQVIQDYRRFAGNDVLTTLTLLSAEKLLFHETHEKERLDRVCRSIMEEGVIHHPALALKLPSGNYLLLDGAHRVMAMKELGCKGLAVQVVEEQQVRLRAWNHLLPMGEWWEALGCDPHITWSDTRMDGRLLAHVTEATGREYFLYPRDTDENLFTHLTAWHRIVSKYQHGCIVQRVADGGTTQFREGEVLFSYPDYTLEELKWVVENDRLMPAGVTRTIVQGRLLNLRISLDLLQEERFDQHRWEELLQGWSRSLRLYTEPVYICEG
ncbi:ParB-like nuclease domain-containing protein [Marininema mesophilum]|uniref:ParB-like nuclease domain-containing protein n=1 Tax=Marininema mesophilum TaxID=1048340 RepID=A0A1H2QBJ1_9BACL|nr:ParB N-terminal domain-containing protein [Marininema mesophilum]SDW04148.1 ParB-like nuclease domain-containing protein [Marininema mesophilum]